MRFRLDTRNVFFTGKGGVGKTSLACSVAVTLADQGKRVLLVSTDPASNLDEVLGVALTAAPSPVPGVEKLFALNVDPEVAADAYRNRVVGPYRGVLPDGVVARIEEELSGACTTEIAAFDEFTRLLADPRTTVGFDHVIFDTAPTGHTLRLLSLPAAWEGFLATNTSGTSCLGPLAGLQAQRDLYQASLATLSDATKTTIVLVTRPEMGSIAEAVRTRAELAAIGLVNVHLVVNGVFASSVAHDVVSTALERRGREALAILVEQLGDLPRSDVPLRARAPLGIDGLRMLLSGETPDASSVEPTATVPAATDRPSLRALIDSLESSGHGVILTMGKGGVGKTTIAAAVAAELARRGHAVHLTTTDPAAHVLQTIGATLPGLTISRIDAVQETADYTSEVLGQASTLDARGRALLEEDLRSPCTEEVAVFRAFARVVAAGDDGFVVIDTAPTGHTLLLLDAAQAYHRQVERTSGVIPDSVRTLLPQLRDGAYARVVLVALPEATPVHEALTLQGDLQRAGIAPYAWVVNQSFALSGSVDPLLRARGAREEAYVAEIRQHFAGTIAVVPWVAEPPIGTSGLRHLVDAPAAHAPDVPSLAS